MTGAPPTLSPDERSRATLPRDTLALWLTLRRLPGVGTRTQHELLEHFGSIEAYFFRQPRSARQSCSAGKHEAVNAILDGPEAQTFQSEFDWLEQPGHHLLVWTDPDYPVLLREIPDPPADALCHR